MKRLLSDLFSFFKSINSIDLLLYIAILILIILIVSLLYIIKTSDEENEELEFEEQNKEIDLQDVVTKMEDATPSAIEFTSYEKDQEEKAIISYDELLKKSKKGTINYAEEEVVNNEISVKKINLNNLINTEIEEPPTKRDTLFRYEKEEAFLESLKKLNQLLN